MCLVSDGTIDCVCVYRRLTAVAPGVAVAGRSTPVLVTLKQLDARHRDAANVTLRLYPDPVTPSAPARAVAETNVFIQGITSSSVSFSSCQSSESCL